MPRPRRLVIVALACAVGLAGAACGSSTTTSGGQTGTTVGVPENTIVPAAAVTAGFVKVRATVAQIKATLATDPTGADALTKTLEEQWASFEGTVRQNDKVAYLQIEDGLAAVNSGVESKDQAKVDKGVADVEAGATAYLAKHP